MENGEVIALLDIANCLYDAIARMERAAEKGKAIAADSNTIMLLLSGAIRRITRDVTYINNPVKGG